MSATQRDIQLFALAIVLAIAVPAFAAGLAFGFVVRWRWGFGPVSETAASLRRGWKESVDGDVLPIGTLWDGIDVE